MKLVQTKTCKNQYQWTWYNERNEAVSPSFASQDEALDWLELNETCTTRKS
jgi:hypothetical protein